MLGRDKVVLKRKKRYLTPYVEGARFGHLTLLHRYERDIPGRFWQCRCSCGELTIKRTDKLRKPSVNCGHLTPPKHPLTRTPTYTAWRWLIRNEYLTIDKRWLKFANFAKDMGERPPNTHLALEEINDNIWGPQDCWWKPDAPSLVKKSKHELSREAQLRRWEKFGKSKGVPRP